MTDSLERDNRPRSECALSVEQGLAEIWCDVLESDSVVADDDFFEVGGHSLLALVLIRRIYEVFGVKCRLVEIFRNRTLGEQIGLVTAGTGHR